MGTPPLRRSDPYVTLELPDGAPKSYSASPTPLPASTHERRGNGPSLRPASTETGRAVCSEATMFTSLCCKGHSKRRCAIQAFRNQQAVMRFVIHCQRDSPA